MNVINFEAERLKRRPWAALSIESLRALRLLKAAHGDVATVKAIGAEIARREAADARLGTP